MTVKTNHLEVTAAAKSRPYSFKAHKFIQLPKHPDQWCQECGIVKYGSMQPNARQALAIKLGCYYESHSSYRRDR